MNLTFLILQTSAEDGYAIWCLLVALVSILESIGSIVLIRTLVNVQHPDVHGDCHCTLELNPLSEGIPTKKRVKHKLSSTSWPGHHSQSKERSKVPDQCWQHGSILGSVHTSSGRCRLPAPLIWSTSWASTSLGYRNSLTIYKRKILVSNYQS